LPVCVCCELWVVRKEKGLIWSYFLLHSVIKQQIKLRENALQQAETLLEYKRAFCHHPSHLGPKKGQEGGLLSIFVSLLAEPLSRTGNARTDTDHLTIELVLHLLRNLLAAEPLLGSSKSESLHHELISLFDRELVLELLLVLAADIEQRENAQYNLLLMELLHHLLRNQDPLAVAKSVQQQQKKPVPKPAAAKEGGSGRIAQKKTLGALSDKLRREKQAKADQATSRHSHFGGTLVVKRPDGRSQFVSAAALGTASVQQQQQPKRRKNKKAEPFIGALQRGSAQRHPSGAGSPMAQRAAVILHKFCVRFVEGCYGPVMKSIKNEFRRDSVRLEDGDRVVFFQVAWFFCQWWRLAGGNKKLGIESKASSCIGQLIFTMDVFTFNLVLNATDTFFEHKKYSRLAQSVALLSEMMHLLYFMYTSTESTEQIMAMGLMDRLYYSKEEPLDRLPKLLSRWTPGTSSREYLCDLVECCHMTLKLLDANAKSSLQLTQFNEAAKHDTLLKMKAAAAEFDVSAYFGRKIVSNHTVFMYTQLLSQYAVVAPTVNHRVVAFFMRLCKHELSLGDVNERPNNAYDEDVPKNPLAPKAATFEPMLYNIQLLTVLNVILNDMAIRKDKDYATLLQFSTKIVHNFAVAAQANPMLFVEALFKHPLPHRYCESVTNMYVTEDLRMLVERDLLLQQQQRLEQETAALGNDDDDDDDDDDDSDEELEFSDLPASSRPVRALVDSDDEDDAKPAAKRKAESGMTPSANKKRVAADEKVLDDSDVEGIDTKASSNKRSLVESSDDESDTYIGASAAERGMKRLEMLSKSRKQQKTLPVLNDDDEASSSDDDDDLFASKPKNKEPAKPGDKAFAASDSED